MPEKRHYYLVAYDIRDPKRWKKVYKKLHGYGRPIQLSLFKSRLNERQLEKLRWELSKILVEEDSLLIVELCARCGTKVVAQNLRTEFVEDDARFQIL